LARLAQGSYKALTDEQENGEAERRIEVLTRDNHGRPAVRPFEAEGNPQSEDVS